MAILKRRFLVSTLVALVSGCVSSPDSFWLTDKELDKYRQRGGVEVSSPSGLYNGILEMEPTNRWRSVQLPITQIRIELPSTTQIADRPQCTWVSLYEIHSRYPDSRFAAGVEIRRSTKDRYEEDLERARRISAKLVAEGRLDRQQAVDEEWQYETFHPTLDVNASGTLYRRDIRFPNGDVLWIRGDVSKLIDTRTGQTLYPEMDAVVRRIINSIEPLDVTTNK
jgi:hypothetical protein